MSLQELQELLARISPIPWARGIVVVASSMLAASLVNALMTRIALRIASKTRTKVDDELVPSLEAERSVRSTVVVDRAHLVVPTLAVPRGNTGAFAGVGGRDSFADQRIQQCRLAGVHHAGDRDARRLVEQRVEGLQGIDLIRVGARDRRPQQASDSLDVISAHDGQPRVDRSGA